MPRPDLKIGFNNSGVIIHESAQIDETAQLGPNVVIGAGCKIGAGVRIKDSAVLDNSEVKAYTYINHCIIGLKNTIGSWVRMTELTCTSEDVQVKDESSLTNVKILPHKPVTGVHANEILM